MVKTDLDHQGSLKVLAAAVVLISLVGCGGTNKLKVTESQDALGQPITTTEYTLTDTGIYHKSIADSTESKTRLAERKAQEIREVDISAQSTDAQALLNQDKIKGIGSIEVKAYEGEAPVTVGKVAQTAVGIVPAVVSGTVQGIAIVEAGKTLRNALDKKTVEIKDSEDVAVEVIDEDNDQTQVATANDEATAATGEQVKGTTPVEEEVVIEDEEVMEEVVE